VRLAVIKRRRWLAFIVVSICLAISASYEFLEWVTAVATGGAADAFLGTQGDPWDTQKDMFMALIGAGVAMAFFTGLQDRAIEKVRARLEVAASP